MQSVPCDPLRIDDVPVYSSYQVQLFGRPDTWGVHDYHVIDMGPEMVMDYKMAMDRDLLPIHRYSRPKRFETLLYQLLAYKGSVPATVITQIREIGVDPHPAKVWDSVRELLKHFGWRIYYNRIPVIILELGLDMRIDLGDNTILLDEIMAEFMLIHHCFEQARGTRKYFPNLRYVALKLLRLFGADFGYHVPLLRTVRKLPVMELFWTKIMMMVDDNRLAFL